VFIVICSLVTCLLTQAMVQTLAEVDSFSAHSGSITSMVLVGNQVWSASEDCSIVLWDVKGAKQVAKIVHNPTAPCAVLALKKVGNSIWSGGADKSIVIWDTTVRMVQPRSLHRNLAD